LNYEKIKILVTGRVQGVLFRAYTNRIANSLNIKGYVKNLFSGDVEIVAKGEEEIMEQFLKKIKIGPPAARVDSIQTKEISEPIDYETFQISY